PAGVVRVSIDPATGLRAYPDQQDALEEVFLSGTEPTEVAVPDAGVGDGGEAVDGSAPDAGAPAANDAGAPPSSGAEMGERTPPFSGRSGTCVGTLFQRVEPSPSCMYSFAPQHH